MSVYAENSFWINTEHGSNKVTADVDRALASRAAYVVVGDVRIYEGDLDAFVEAAKKACAVESKRAWGDYKE